MVDSVSRFARPGRIVDDAALIEGRGRHAALDTFHQADILDLQDIVHIGDGLNLRRRRLRCFKEEGSVYKPCASMLCFL